MFLFFFFVSRLCKNHVHLFDAVFPLYHLPFDLFFSLNARLVHVSLFPLVATYQHHSLPFHCVSQNILSLTLTHTENFPSPWNSKPMRNLKFKFILLVWLRFSLLKTNSSAFSDELCFCFLWPLVELGWKKCFFLFFFYEYTVKLHWSASQGTGPNYTI